MAEINIGKVKNGKGLVIAGGDILKNASPDMKPRRSSSKNKITIKEIDGITDAVIAGGDVIEYTESNFKKALATLESVVASANVDKGKRDEFKELAKQMKRFRPGVDTATVKKVWEKMVGIVNLAGLASGGTKLVSTVWPFIANFLKIG